MPYDDHKNFAYATVATAPSPATSGTSLTVIAGTGGRFPTPPFNATIWPDAQLAIPTNAEIVRVTAIATDTLTITRAQESSTARTVVVGDQIAATITDKTLTDIETTLATGLVVLDRDVTPVTVSNTTTETTVYSYTVPGGTLGTNGLLKLVCVIDLMNNQVGSTTFTIRVKYGGQLLHIHTTGTHGSNPNRKAFWLDVRLAAGGATNAQRSSAFSILGPYLSASAAPTSVSLLALTDMMTETNNALTVDSSVDQPFIVTFAATIAAVEVEMRLHTAHLLKG